MSADLFDHIPEAVATDVPVTRRRGRKAAPITKLGTTEPPEKKKKVNLNPYQRKWFEANGYTVLDEKTRKPEPTFWNVETQNPYGGVSSDMFGIIDYVAIRADQPGTLYVQVTTLTNVSARRKKILACPVTAVLLKAQNRVQIHGWHQPKGPGTRWEVRIEDVTL